MTEELKQAAQAALDQLEFLNACYPHKTATDAADALRRALTQRPAAQTEREAFENAARAKWGPLDFERSEAVPEMYYNQRLDDAWIGFGFAVAWLRASLPAPQQATPAPSAVFSAWWSTQGQSMWQHVSESPAEFARRLAAHAWTEATRAAQQATPEPVGEPDTVPLDALHEVERERDYWKSRAKAMWDHAEGTCWYWMGDGEDHLESLVNSLPVVIRADQLRELLARPAPGVPEGFALVPVEPTPAMKSAGIEVEIYSEVSDSIGALTWAEVAAIYRAMLAAAQAKGGCDGA